MVSNTTVCFDILRIYDPRLPQGPYGVAWRCENVDDTLFPDHWNDYYRNDNHIEADFYLQNEYKTNFSLEDNVISYDIHTSDFWTDLKYCSNMNLHQELYDKLWTTRVPSISPVSEDVLWKFFGCKSILQVTRHLSVEFHHHWTMRGKVMTEYTDSGALIVRVPIGICLHYNIPYTGLFSTYDMVKNMDISEFCCESRSVKSYSMMSEDEFQAQVGVPRNDGNSSYQNMEYPPKVRDSSGDIVQVDFLKFLIRLSIIMCYGHVLLLIVMMIGATHWKRTRFRLHMCSYPRKHTKFRMDRVMKIENPNCRVTTFVTMTKFICL